MKLLFYTAPLLFVSLLLGTSNSILVDDVRETVIDEFHKAWKELKVLKRTHTLSQEKNLEELAKLLTKVPGTIRQVEQELVTYEEALNDLPRNSTWSRKWSEIAILTSPVDVIYGYLKVFPDMPGAFTSGMIDFDAESVTNLILKPLYETKGPNTLTYLSEHAHEAVVSKHEKDLFTLLREEIQSTPPCSSKTGQRMIYGLYVKLLLTDIKEYAVINFARMLQFLMNGTTTADVQSLRIQAIEKKALAKHAIDLASPILYRCDPHHFVEGHNYEQFKELLQGYIENEVRMHPKSSCKQSCADYTFVRSRCSYPDDESCFKHRVCTGDIVECKYVAADATVCLADAPRRFDYVDYKNGPLLGKSVCNGETTRRDSYWRLFYHCSNCFCLCDDPNSPTTVRHISLAPVVADEGKIVTGVKFTMKDGILQIQIEQGKPVKDGLVDDFSTEWKDLPQLSKKSPNVMQMDYINRAFDLDDVIVPPSYVVTGIRFRHLGSHVNMEVQATQINPLTAELIQSSTHWLSNDNTPETNSPRAKLVIEDADIPIFTPKPSVVDSLHDQFIEFGPTSREKDAAQLTIPFLDIQIVRPDPPVWLEGVGVYHKGREGYGGFLGLRVKTRNVDLGGVE